MYKYVFCCYVESDFGGDPFITHIPLETGSLEEGLETTLEQFQSIVGNYIPTKIVHKLHRLTRTSLNKETRWVMVAKGKYAGTLGMVADIGKTGIGLLDFETGITYLMPKKDVFEVPHWDFEGEIWTLDKQ